MQSNNANERRESFRVDMTARVAVAVDPGNRIDASDCFPELHAMSLLSQSNSIEQEINLYSDRIKDLAVKKTLDLLHQKMTLIAKLIDIQTVESNNMEMQNINISEGGCSINQPSEAEVGQRIALALIFSPNYFALFTFAKVTDVERGNDEYRYHLVFEELSETQRQGLLKHMFQAQTAAKKSPIAE